MICCHNGMWRGTTARARNDIIRRSSATNYNFYRRAKCRKYVTLCLHAPRKTLQDTFSRPVCTQHRGDHRQNLNAAKPGDGKNAGYVINVLSQRCYVTCARVVTACALLRRAVTDGNSKITSSRLEMCNSTRMRRCKCSCTTV